MKAKRSQPELRIDVPTRPSLLTPRSWSALAVYAVIVAVAFVIAKWQDLPLVRMADRAHPDHALSVVFGTAIALLTIGATRWAVPRLHWFGNLHRDFRDLLGPLQRREIAVFALSSGLAEELLFRGALVPTLGIVASSVIFGAVHIAPRAPRWVWPTWAAMMGLVFAALYLATGSLYGPIVAHVLINAVNLDYINRFDLDAATLNYGTSAALNAEPVDDSGTMAPGRSRSS